MAINITDWEILIVDDEPDNLSVLEMILTYYDARVTSTKSSSEALNLFGERTFRLALLDIQMPTVTGWDLIKYIRQSQNPATCSMTTIAVTAYAMAGDRERILAAGFDGYISKPVDVATFIQSIEETVNTRHVLALTAEKPTMAGEKNER